MLFSLVFATRQAINVDRTCNPKENATYKLESGLYSVEIIGAQGGDSCKHGVFGAFGGNGSIVQAQLRIKGEYSVVFSVGEKPPTDCTKEYNRGGFPEGGYGGSDKEGSGNEQSGGGGGLTELKIKDTNIAILIAGGGGGAAYSHVGGYGGDFGTNGGYIIVDADCKTSGPKHTDSRAGGTGVWSQSIPGGGGGSGYPGGVGGTWSIYNDYCSAGYGGSSYYNETLSNQGWFDGVPTVINGSIAQSSQFGHGCYQIHIIYKCPNFCYHCLSKDVCEQCNSDAYSYKGKCYLSCDHTYTALGEGTYVLEGTHQCAKCHSSCETCSGQSSDQCTSCPDGMVLYQGYCKPPSTPVYTPVITPITTPVMTFHETPFETMYETPFLTMHETAFETPYLTNHETPFNTVFETPFTTNHETPYETPFTTMFNTPYLTEFETPFVTNHETPFETQFITAFETPYLTNFETPFVTAFETPFSTNEVTAFETPFMSMFETPFSTAFETNHKTPFISMFETPYNTAFQTAFETAFETPFITAKETEEIQDIPIPIPEPEKSSSYVSSSSSKSLPSLQSSSVSSSSTHSVSSSSSGQESGNKPGNYKLDSDASNKEKNKKSIMYGIIGAVLALIIIIAIIVVAIYFYHKKDTDVEYSSTDEEMVVETVISTTTTAGDATGITIDNPLWTTTVNDDSEDVFKQDFEERRVDINIYEV
ncbi:mucin, putative [Trichomonas vaginalis G3]|uniref:receptor protein-tyrosine kinase n=1 Tax=Trichomonas vaginalis (strain ATCC PRA-98 / G3) TaxID=412133 RepID=A2FKJ7_TRIV3|nr:bifunctional inhibitor/lipid-transfer protein/seed storage 2s albumin superfamily protein family [Trichomonas vaginalis G3]EAX94570.1 mucin, putative [Trichomonas vaginalis G3]KAI5482786.1 bifunctional inhibitor/lipid-transfer protein/seed storage 2s albumin superfamily protein family [Trichomonas vaginalis G3]|eukprot:XP_001307500.1 mucin [Trichomonas vaginalis G3]